jgi:nitroimidazol reductase NimA-like FMN-containing flavoprotein (pyridoxamine 5'-phosphate oxidase superfamily)
MRAAKKEIKDPAVITDLFTQSHVGRLGTIGADGSPMIKPLNFVYLDGDIYFHSAREGEKMDDMKRDARVCFEIDLPLGYVRNDKSPCRAGYRYRSVIVKGRALTVEGYGPIPEDKLALTAVVRIIIHRVSGKEDPG